MKQLKIPKLSLSLAVATTLLVSACGGSDGNADEGGFSEIPTNKAPLIACDPVSGSLEIGKILEINCVVSDDELPASSTVALSWSSLQTPIESGTLNLPAESSISFTPTIIGTYTLGLTANDGALVSKKDVSFTVIAAPVQASVKILPLGDSITQGSEFYQSYRYPLWKKLVDSEIEFDLVGSLIENYIGTPDFPDYKGLSFDQDHEGHWGFRVDEILNLLPGSLFNL